MHQDFASNAKCNFADFRTNTHTLTRLAVNRILKHFGQI